VDDTHTRRGEGTGIGLAVTKEIVDLLEGDLEVASRPNKGTVFTVSLPIKHLSPLDGEDISTSPQDKSIISHKPSTIDSDARYSEDLPSVLIVEDNSDVAFYIRQCLDEQYNVFHAADGKLGIEHAHENIPDIIISDIMMPEVDGFELCERLKGDPITNHIPIILLTAKTKQEDKITGLSKGADAYLSKPFNKEELLVRVNKLIELRQSLKEKYASTISTNNLQDGLSKMAKKPLDKNQQFLAEVIELIVQHMSDNNFKSALLSRKLGMSESQLYRKLKAISGKSTALFIRSIRLKKARELLLSGMLNVSEVAYECGFTDPSWFSRVYKETFGESPVESKSS
jgi:DNA-binding response OmpR family regulator